MPAADKTLFAPKPLRAMRANLSGLQHSALDCVAAHDRMSLVVGKGQGCRASNERMAEMIGCSYARICSTLSELVEMGFLQREKIGRHTVYRVIYNDADRLLFGNVIGRTKAALSVSRSSAIGCRPPLNNGGNLPETTSQYISLNEGIDSEESGEDISSEEARFAARRLSRRSSPENVGAELARLERALDAGEAIDRIAAYDSLGDVFVGDQPESIRHWALRLSDKIVESMTPDEEARWRAQYGAAA